MSPLQLSAPRCGGENATLELTWTSITKVRFMLYPKCLKTREKHSGGSQMQPDRKGKMGWMVQSEERDEEEWQTLKKSQDGCLERKSSSSHQAPICSGTNHC